MPLVDLGTVDLGTAVPAAVTLGGIAAPNVSAQVAALATFTPSVGLSFNAQLDIVAKLQANLIAALAAIPPIPTIDLSAQVALAASISVALNAQLAIILSLTGFLSAGSIRLLAWDGANNALPPALSTALGPSATHSNAVILYTQDPAAWVAISGILKTS